MTNQWQQVIKAELATISPYHVQSSAGLLKLDAMESPYHLPDEMRQALGTVLSLAPINRYPNPQSTSLSAKIKRSFQLPDDAQIILGNGSDELIQLILMATAKPKAVVLSPAPSFVMYEHMAKILSMDYVGVDLAADFSLDEKSFLDAIARHQPAVIFLAFPNNPTGQLLHKDFIRQVLESAPGLVVIDEAYSAYASDNAAELIAEYDNAILIRTFSKIGLAGIRLGYLAAQPTVVKEIDKVRMPYNINVLTKATARFMLDQLPYINRCVADIKQEKARLYQWLGEQRGLTVFPSETNFLLVRVAHADEIFRRLRDEHKILIKNLHGVHPILDNILRITIGSAAENNKLRQALTVIIDS